MRHKEDDDDKILGGPVGSGLRGLNSVIQRIESRGDEDEEDDDVMEMDEEDEEEDLDLESRDAVDYPTPHDPKLFIIKCKVSTASPGCGRMLRPPGGWWASADGRPCAAQPGTEKEVALRLMSKAAQKIMANGGVAPSRCISSVVSLDAMVGRLYVEGPNDEVVKEVCATGRVLLTLLVCVCVSC